jgi:DNA polymerase III epsilon subunit-like protein
MVTSLPRLRPASQELLNNIALARRLRDAEEVLYEDWQRFVRGLEPELRSLCPALKNWARPWVYIDAEVAAASLNIESNAAWMFRGEAAVCLYLSIFLESVLDDDRYAPNVGLSIDPAWEHHDALCALLEKHRPPGFTSTYEDGTTDPETPFWKPLPLKDFLNDGTFDRGRFVKEIVAAFESLAAVRAEVDAYLAEHSPPRPLVARLKRALILDLETWQGKPDEIVEVGLILTAYDPKFSSGELLGEIDRYEGLRDPGPRATAKPSSRITAKMVKGKKLNDKVEALIGEADVIIAHNAFGFDKPRFERLFQSSKSRRWLCSCDGLAWSSSGSKPANLPDLCTRHGITNRDPHRAMPDAEALLQLLAQKHGAVSYFAELVGSSAGG